MTNWRKFKLINVCTKIGSGATPRGGDASYKNEGVSLIRSQNVLDFTFSNNGLAFIDDVQAKGLANVEIKERDVLVNITGDSVARVCQVPENTLPARVNQHVAILRANTDLLNPEFLKYSLLSRQNKEMLLSLASTGATRKALTKVMLEQFEIELPDEIGTTTQTRIASILSSLDDKIELNRRTKNTLEQMAQTLFKKYFVTDIDPDNLPKDWRWGKLGELFTLQRGYDLPNTQREEGKIPVIAASGFNGFHNKVMVKGPGITTGRSGVIGNVFFIIEDFWPLNTSLFIKEFKISSPLHAFYVLKLIDLAGMNTGSAVPTLNRNEVHSINLIIPTREVIFDFETKVFPLFKMIRENEKQNESISKIRNILLPKLINGKIEVN